MKARFFNVQAASVLDGLRHDEHSTLNAECRIQTIERWTLRVEVFF